MNCLDWNSREKREYHQRQRHPPSLTFEILNCLISSLVQKFQNFGLRTIWTMKFDRISNENINFGRNSIRFSWIFMEIISIFPQLPRPRPAPWRAPRMLPRCSKRQPFKSENLNFKFWSGRNRSNLWLNFEKTDEMDVILMVFRKYF